jgi:hypothetical protein
MRLLPEVVWPGARSVSPQGCVTRPPRRMRWINAAVQNGR